MRQRSVLIRYRPRLYRELFKRALQCYGTIRVLEEPSQMDKPSPASADSAAPELPAEIAYTSELSLEDMLVDVVVLSLNRRGRPDLSMMPGPLPEATVLAFSPGGDLGFLRPPGKKRWVKMRPYGFGQLVQELAGASGAGFAIGEEGATYSATPGDLLEGE